MPFKTKTFIVNWRKAGGGSGYPPSLSFFLRIVKKKTVPLAPPIFAYLFMEHFDTFPESFDLLTSKVTPPDRIK